VFNYRDIYAEWNVSKLSSNGDRSNGERTVSTSAECSSSRHVIRERHERRTLHDKRRQANCRSDSCSSSVHRVRSKVPAVYYLK